MRPLIGITSDIKDGRCFIKQDYARSVEKAGACPVILQPIGNIEAIKDIAHRLNGLIISGGGDIDPIHYGEERQISLSLVSEERFVFEKALLRSALEQKMPVLGICYGMQFLNVFLGGTLYQDIGQIPSVLDHEKEHEIDVYKDGVLYYILSKESIRVNSSHHQAVKRLGTGLRCIAEARDGLIEAVAMDDYPFFLGVQWHPERFDSSDSDRIFKAFIEVII